MWNLNDEKCFVTTNKQKMTTFRNRKISQLHIRSYTQERHNFSNSKQETVGKLLIVLNVVDLHGMCHHHHITHDKRTLYDTSVLFFILFHCQQC